MFRLLILAILFSILGNVRSDCISCAGGQSYCYDSSACPGFPPPQCPELFGLNIQLYTRQNPADGQGQIITKDSIPSFFNGAVLTIYLIHGWLRSENAVWMHEVKNNLLAQGDYNVIIFGWPGGADNPSYQQASSDTRTVGAYVALINSKTITDGKSSRALQYCVGHSLGAHVCGFAGKQGQFGRITGLDPAGLPYFVSDGTCGLNKSSADLVDVIHTNTILWGNPHILGHVDFFPNGGKTQPGCPILSPQEITGTLNDLTLGISFAYVAFDAGTGVIACDHYVASDYYAESINTTCFLSRYNCSDQYNLPSSCSKSTTVVQSMGFNSNTYPNRGIFYLETNAFSPYCQN